VGKLDKKALRKQAADSLHPSPVQVREGGARGGGVMGDNRS
jgi:hypothetical protein